MGMRFQFVRRLAAIFLLVFYISLGSGLLHFLHERDHAMMDAREDAIAQAAGKPVTPHNHDDCDVCEEFNVLVMWFFVAWMPPLNFLGLLIAFLTLLPISLVSRRVPARIDCRGPPPLMSLQNFAA
jgi:hypothetical protein